MQRAEARQLLSSSVAEDFAGALRKVVAECRSNGWLTVTQVAELSGMSIRSLQRRLAEEGVIFSELVEQLRYELAVQLLENTKMSLVEIAKELGYSSQPNFSRACKRWTGQSPGDYRDEK